MLNLYQFLHHFFDIYSYECILWLVLASLWMTIWLIFRGEDYRRAFITTFHQKNFVTDIILSSIVYVLNILLSGISVLIIIKISMYVRGLFRYDIVPVGASISIFQSFIISIMLLLVIDFVNYVSHYIFHRSKFLWRFHRIHHAPRSLNFFTLNRVHPVEEIIKILLRVIVIGIVAGLCMGYMAPLFVQWVTIYLMMGLIQAIIFYPAAHFRHSHIPLVYPRWLSYILISPAQHQYHHHYTNYTGQNMGVIFAFWDYAFGTMSVQQPEYIRYGLKHDRKPAYMTWWQLLCEPFIQQGYIVPQKQKTH